MTAPLHVKRSFSVLRWRLYYLVRLISKRLRKSECQESRYQHRRSMWVLNCCCFFHEQISAQSKGEKSYLSNFKFQHFSGGVARLGWGWQWQISTINWQWRGGGRVSVTRNQSFRRVLQQLWRSLSGPWEPLRSWTTGDASASLSWSALQKSMLESCYLVRNYLMNVSLTAL